MGKTGRGKIARDNAVLVKLSNKVSEGFYEREDGERINYDCKV